MITQRKYHVVLQTKEPFRIGGKEDPLAGADNPVAKVGNRIVIPGSTLKGALRSEIEKYLIDKNYDSNGGGWHKSKEALKPCIPGTRLSVDEKKLIEDDKYSGESCHYPCNDRRCGKNAYHFICPACYLLGAQELEGFVRVPFLFADLATSELYSARIDRARKTVSTGTNRPYELVPDGVKFEGDLYINLADSRLGWKLSEPRPLKDRTGGDKWLEQVELGQEDFIKVFILDRLKAISILGGYKSKGFGLVEIKVSGGE